MAYNTGDLNGSGPFYIRLDVNYSGVQSGNSSRFDWTVYIGCSSNGWGTYGIGGSVHVNIGGQTGSYPLPTVDFRPSSSSARLIAVKSGSTWIAHASNGTRPGFENFASIDSNHGSVGDGSVGGVWVDAPAIGSVPSVPGNPTFSEITATSVRVSWAASSSNGGRSIDAYLLRRRDVVNGPYVDNSALNTSRVITGLTPGKSYFFSVYAHNSIGYSAQTAQLEVRTLSGGQVKNEDDEWDRSIPHVQVAGLPRAARALVKLAGVWKPAS